MVKIGVICPSEIAFRRFMPAIKQNANFYFVGIAYASKAEWFEEIKNNNNAVIKNEYKKAVKFIDEFGGKVFHSYSDLITSDEIDAVYLPLPPSLHYRWAKMALENGKHILCEKPFTTNLNDTLNLIEIAKQKNLAIHENYMFKYHSQIEYIKKLLDEKVIGEIRNIRIAFGFPFRGEKDFRYNKSLGGGALLDCGGYTIKLATELLGETARIISSQLNYKDNIDVDLYGSATAINSDGLTAQLVFGMDNNYKCELEIWGSTGTIYTNRIMTAPVGFEPTIIIKQGNEEKISVIPSDDTFAKSINTFFRSINDGNYRIKNYDDIYYQAKMVDEFLKGAIL